MDEDIKKLLSEEITRNFQELPNFEQGSTEQTTAIDNLATLYKLKIEETKMELDSDDKMNRLVADEQSADKDRDIKRDQLNEQVKDRYFKFGIAAAELMIPLMFYGVWMKKGFKFEETGTYTSATFRGLFNRFRPTKK